MAQLFSLPAKATLYNYNTKNLYNQVHLKENALWCQRFFSKDSKTYPSPPGIYFTTLFTIRAIRYGILQTNLENCPCVRIRPSSRIGNFTSQLATMFWILKSMNFAWNKTVYIYIILSTSWLPGFARASPSLLLPPHSLLLSTLPPSDYPASPRIFAV